VTRRRAATVRQEVIDLKEELVRLRRDFHRHPELGLQERRTASAVASYLGDLGLEVEAGIGGTGVAGLLRGGAPGKTLLLRADMDALPIQEQNEVEYRSANEGVMHACGHDGHTAILLAVAKVLRAHREEIRGQVKLVFQPGEEGMGGARRMIEAGVLENPRADAAFALHLLSVLPYGVVGVRNGAILASMDSFNVRFLGKGGHAAMPEGGVDAILTAAQAITALQSLISREVSPMTPLVVHVGTIHGGQAFNIVADRVEVGGTVRTLDEALQSTVPERMDRILKGVTGAFRGSHELEYRKLYAPVVNDASMTDLVREVARQVVGQENTIEVLPAMGSDDMAFFLKEVPGSYFFVGAANAERGLTQPHHNPRFDLEEESLLTGAEMMTRLALSYLGDGRG
jgi:amidohydrolase